MYLHNFSPSYHDNSTFNILKHPTLIYKIFEQTLLLQDGIQVQTHARLLLQFPQLQAIIAPLQNTTEQFK